MSTEAARQKTIAMARPENDLVIARVFMEEHQNHGTRKDLFLQLEQEFGRPVLSFFTSFVYPVAIESGDVDMLEGILQTMDLSSGLAILISSPGGDGLAAERIINICRQYSGTNEYWTIVPSRAKSAATMICLGASKIIMGPSSELGPIDPQLTTEEDGNVKRFSVWNIVESYKKLFNGACRAKGNLQPYLQQLQHYDSREIKEFETALDLSEDIAIRSLMSGGMMDGQTKTRIRKNIETFLTPKQTKDHGRPIYADEAQRCKLKVETHDPKSKPWQLVYELYIRTNNFVSGRASKCVETATRSFAARARDGE